MNTEHEDRPLTDAEQTALSRWGATRAKRQKAREQRIAKLTKAGTYTPPVAWRGPGTAARAMTVEQHGVKLSTRQQAQQDDADAALEALDDALPLVHVRAPDYEAVKADVAETIKTGRVERTTEVEQWKAAMSPRARMVRDRKMPEVIPGTEHLDAKQRATLADMRRRLRESEAALAAYRRDRAEPHTIATAKRWVAERASRLESKMRQFGVPNPTE